MKRSPPSVFILGLACLSGGVAVVPDAGAHSCDSIGWFLELESVEIVNAGSDPNAEREATVWKESGELVYDRGICRFELDVLTAGGYDWLMLSACVPE